MNTKGIKFLAVLAVMVMAFAAIVVLAPADKDVTAIEVYGNKEVIVDPKVIEGDEKDDDGNPVIQFYFSDDASVKIRGLNSKGATFYVQNGKELEVNFKLADTNTTTLPKITIVTVTADQQRHTTSTVDIYDASSHGENGQVNGKIVINDTEVTFVGKNNLSVIYTAMMPLSVDTHTTSGDNIVTYVSTGKSEKSQQYATISADAVLDQPVIKQYVTIAAGQSIQTSNEGQDAVSIKYGIKTEIGGETTYYALKANAGTETIKSGEKVTVKNGTITVNTEGNEASVKANSASSYTSVKFEYASGNAIKASGTLNSGSLAVSGKAVFSNFTDKATVTLNSSATVVADSKITVSGTLILKNENDDIEKLSVEGEGMIVAQNEKLWTYEAGATTPELVFANSGETGFFSGQFDVYAITKVADVKEAFSTAKIERNQTFRVVADTVVTTSLDVLGVLIVEPGVTLTITKTNNLGAAVATYGQYAQIINNGEILIKTTTGKATGVTEVKEVGLHVYGGYFENNGRLVASSDSKVTSDEYTFIVDWDTAYPTALADEPTGGMGFINNGVMTVSKNDNISLDSMFTNGKEGSVSVNGSLTGNSLVNGGLFTLNNAKVTDAAGLTVTMKKGAEFNVSAAEVGKNVAIIIQNLDSDKNVTASITVTAPNVNTTGKYVIRGLYVDDTSTSYGNKLDLSGNISLGLPSDVDKKTQAKLATTGSIDVTTTATISSGYELGFTATKLNVPGSLTLSDGVTIKPAPTATSLNMVVTGDVTVIKGNLDSCTYVAAKYTLSDNTTIYTTLADAVAGATLAETSFIEVGCDVANKNYVKVTGDLIVPTDMTITGVDKCVLIVDNKATLYVQSAARLSIENIIVEDGVVIAEDANDVDLDTITADVVVEDDESTAVTCMSLEVALAIATPGDVIELSNTFFAKDLELVIPEGVTVDATANDKTQFILVNSDLIVNGALVVDQFKFIATTDDTIGITVNGYIYDACSDGACITGWWYTPFGVSYNVTDDEDHVWYVLTNIDNIQPAINIADDAKVAVEGDAKLDELNLSGRDDMPAEVTFKGDVDIDTITITDTTLKFTKGKEITATIKDALGSITVTGAYAGDKMSIYSMDDAGVYMAGTVTDGTEGTYGILFEGITGMDGTSKAAITWGNYVKETDVPLVYEIAGTPTIIFAGETLATGKKVIINENDENSNGMATITGTLVADNGTKLVFNSDVQVLGGLIAAERTEDAVAGSIEMNGDLFVGALKAEIYDAEAALAAYEMYTDKEPVKGADYGQALAAKAEEGTAVVSGKIDLVKAEQGKKQFFITVMEGSVVDPAIVEDLTSVEVIIEDSVWLTIYGYGNSDYSMDGLKAPIVNADVDTILDADGNPVADFSFLHKVIYNSPAKKLSEYGYVVISLDYDIFEVKIKTDGSVKAVYIDGILMETGFTQNIFVMGKVAAGTHKVRVEAATGYDADKCVLYTEGGTILPGMAFTFTQYDCTEYDKEADAPVVVYNINGTEIQPEPVPPTPEEESQWTVTTILLVILVVLIAIMAVIVALRLNRS